MDTVYVNTLLCFVNFGLGMSLLPFLCDKILKHKYINMDHVWHEKLNEARQNTNKNKRQAKWLTAQVHAVQGGKLCNERIQALKSCGALSSHVAPAPSQTQAEEKNSFSFSPHLKDRVICGFLSTAIAATLSILEQDCPVVVLSLLIGNIQTLICICDLRARIIPYQLCLIYAPTALVWILFTRNSNNILPSLLIAVLAALCVNLLEKTALNITHISALGAGDRRLIPLICFQVGSCALIPGLCGLCAVALIMAIYALSHGKNKHSYLPFAPPLYAFAAIGSICNCI